MDKTGKAWFVTRPRRRSEIHPAQDNQERPYRVVKTITLGAIDFGNFSEDMLVDRPFLDSFSELCKEPGDCLFIKLRGTQEGFLIIPNQGKRVEAAAWVKG